MHELLNLAMQHHQSGRFGEAETLYRQVLASEPGNAVAHHYLGLLYAQGGRFDLSAESIGRAVELRPEYADAYGNLGNALSALGRPDEALDAYQRAIKLAPGNAQAHYNCGNVLREQGRLNEAIVAYRRAVELRPTFAEAHNNLGDALKSCGELSQAIGSYQRAAQCNPNLPEVHNNLGDALTQAGRIAEAITACNHAIALRKDYAGAYNNLGNALRASGQLEQAITAYRQAVLLHPESPEALNNLGVALSYQRLLDEAASVINRAIQLRPGYAQAHNNLGTVLKEQGRLDDAAAAFLKALEIDPAFAGAHNNLGNVLSDQGQIERAVAAYRRAVDLDPGNAAVDSTYLFSLYYHPGFDPAAIAAEHDRWNRRHADPVRHLIRDHLNDKSCDRRLKIGYVSPDFRDHVVGRNTFPAVLYHDAAKFEITCYSQFPSSDSMTELFRKNSDRWRVITGVSDDDVARQVREDGIDILVDLALHTADNRLKVFAYKPAPVQACFVGFPGSTGLTTIDYRISDPYLDPPGADESFYSEKTIRIPDSVWFYDPLDNSDLPVSPLPAIGTGVVNFGCLNLLAKINGPLVEVWAQVLHRVQKSRLLLLAHPGSHRQLILDRFAEVKIDPGRIVFAAPRPRRQYMELYHQVDLALDTFPYGGHSTSLDALWMGVPVVTRAGPTVVSRAGASQLSNVGLSELVARSAEEFVYIAVGLANDASRLQHLRSTLRQRMVESPLMDPRRYARNIEAAYRQMWNTWCAKSI